MKASFTSGIDGGEQNWHVMVIGANHVKRMTRPADVAAGFAFHGLPMSAEILPFRTKKLSGFLPEEEVRLPAGLEKAYREVRKELADLVDTAPCEYVAPENDPA